MTRSSTTPPFPDPYAPRTPDLPTSFAHALLATALFRCWHILLFFGAWSTAVSLINHDLHGFAMQPTLLTVVGTVLGFVISYRTTSSFERYNEGRRLWSQIMLANRTFACTVWFHIPETNPTGPEDLDENKSRVLVEKKTAINLLEAFSVAIKHYLRGEEGIHYVDLYHLVKFLPPYWLPPTIPSPRDISNPTMPSDLPLPITSSSKKASFFQSPPTVRSQKHQTPSEKPGSVVGLHDEGLLLPARMPPKYSYFDLFPFSLLVRFLTNDGKQVKGRKAARLRARMQTAESQNLPLAISLYLSSYVSALQAQKVADVPTANTLLAALNQLVDALTGLERILTMPIPFSYSFHLWATTVIYCLALPLQIWPTFGWVTIPATVILAFIFFGFLVCGEEIENPFGYDKNDLNVDHFTHNIIRNELRAMTATPAPSPSVWAFHPENNLVFASQDRYDERVAPDDWVKRGLPQMRAALTL
ncbi:hypothetical protein PILCRDRAFT_766254 [Piloderma croceum F 1598]|uniref:Uncharacterized protein n=1 Tax=Piloderma croceum (strain F 1598) TaxID=765440 RepID=A0A0C3CL88_PILCF|nr:hypothetical protein PILCRDRAFT_766254 [Piloderma croceum F 1598]